MEVKGYCDERFVSAKRAFEKNFALGLEVGASFAVLLNGESVVDLWGGFSDPAKTKPWERDTIVNVFSTTKVIAALCLHILVDRGLIDVEAPVCEYWPEFAEANKENVLVKHLLSHSAGLPGFDQEIPIEALYEWDRIIKLLEKQKSWWNPGSKIGYHMITFGYLVGELVRRITGKSLGEFFRDEISVPLNIDFHIGLPESLDSRTAMIIPPQKVFAKWQIFLVKLLFKKTTRVYFNPNLENVDFNSRAWRNAEIPASNGHGNARSIAQVGSILACGGYYNKKRVLSESTVEKAIKPQICGRDVIMLYRPAKFGLGLGLLDGKFFLGPRSFGWGGAGGSLCVMDLEKRLSIGYAMNKMHMKGEDPRTEPIFKAV
ncbi:MAG: class A beta-lactamase-related serine hydrolase, partial [Candidatus Lokiarchaeota archaeon]|nr:class A beta-lactamase-related serine hydrolase [Candidatus Lokiarchaeota archaeon]